MQTLLPGITAERVPTSRLTAAVLSVTGRTGHPVLFVHGNVSSLFWQPTMLAVPEGYRPLAIDLRGFGYAAAGGRYREIVIHDSGHGPHLDQPAQFRAALSEHLAGM